MDLFKVDSVAVVAIKAVVGFIDKDAHRMSLVFEHEGNRKSFSIYLKDKYANKLDRLDALTVIGVPEENMSGIKEVLYMSKINYKNPTPSGQIVIVGANTIWEQMNADNMEKGIYFEKGIHINTKEA